MIWNGLTWLWEVCQWVLVFWRVHSSTELSFIVTSTRLGSNSFPLSRKLVMFIPAGISEKTIVRCRSTCLRRRSTGLLSGPFGSRSFARGPDDTRVRTVWFGVGPAGLSWQRTGVPAHTGL